MEKRESMRRDNDAGMRYVLTIAGSDSCGGAGIQADIRTIAALGAHAMTALTSVTAQNSLGIVAAHDIPEGFISLQIKTVIEDQFPDAVKTGMLSSGPAVREIAAVIKEKGLRNLVVDPVIRASTGRQLLESSAIELMKEELLPLARVITPNIDEAGALTGRTVKDLAGMEEAAREIKDLGPDVIVTGGHLEESCVDLLFNGKDVYYFQGTKLETANTHGSGCVFSASLATFLALEYNIQEAARLAHDFTRHSLEKGYPCGRGAGVVSP
jgi:hydroxymethylpyrimidine/phosphomethylpyrimidine kinase